MSDLISRQAAIDALRVAYFDNNIQSAKDDPCIVDAMTDWAIRQVKALPSAQPEITRCKDCIYFTPEKSGEHWNVCRFYDAPKTADGYCNDAERKEE